MTALPSGYTWAKPLNGGAPLDLDRKKNGDEWIDFVFRRLAGSSGSTGYQMVSHNTFPGGYIYQATGTTIRTALWVLFPVNQGPICVVLGRELRDEGEAARKITIMGTGQNETITLTALTLARLLARSAKVVLVDLSPSSPTLTAVSVDPAAPGLADLMLGEASFGQVITRDKLSSVHLVGAGRPGTDRALLQSPRLTLALDALLRVYDHVLLDAGTATDLPARLLTENARAILVPDPSMSPEARTRMREQLQAIGFGSVTTLSRPSQPSDIQTGPRVAA